MDYPVLAGCGLTRLDAAKVLPPVLLVCQRGCKQSTNLLHLELPGLSADRLKANTINYFHILTSNLK